MKLHQSKIQNLVGRIRLYRDWWKVVAPFNRIYNLRSEHFVTLRSGEKMYIRDIFSYDIPIINELYAQDIYKLHSLSLPNAPTILDVGAHIGSFSVAIHTRYPDAVITAFEPHPSNFSFLKKNAPFAKCVNAAVSSNEGEAHLGDHKASSAYALSDSGIIVKTVTLDSYINSANHIDLLKVDVEGAEKDIFEHLEPEMLKRINKIMMEIHPPHKTEWFSSLFKRAGFSVIVENSMLFAERKQVSN